MPHLTLPADVCEILDDFRSPAGFESVSEHVIRGFYRAFLRPGDTVLDVGVHYGIHLFPMAEAVGQGGRVIGVEASPERFAAISRQIEARGLGQIALHNVAASLEDGTATFHLNRDFTGRSGLLRNDRTGGDAFEEIRVPTRRLDGLLTDLDGLRFCKVDIEGAEAAALVGAAGLLRRFAPVVIYEGVLADSIRAFRITEVAAQPVVAEYRHHDLFGEEIEAGDRGAGWNFLAIPRAAGPELQQEVADALSAAWRSAAREVAG